MKIDTNVSYLANLHRYLLAHGPVACVRVSSAHARGRARTYAYWGIAEYRLEIGARGAPCVHQVSAAPSSRRSYQLAVQDADATGLLRIGMVHGYVTEDQARALLDELPGA